MIENMINVSICNKDKPIHWNNDNMNICFILQGRMTGVVNNRASRLSAGDIWVINREVPFCIENCSSNCIYVQIGMNMEAFNKYIPNIWTVYFKCGPEENDMSEEKLKDEIRAQIYKIVVIMDKNRWSIQNENEILYACIDILNNLKFGFSMIDNQITNEQFDRIWRIVDYMFDNCNRKLTLKEVAKQEFISEAYLSRILREETGRNFEETLAYIRSECSIKYLLETDMSITSIAYECGFSAPRYYNAAFKKYYDCTPAEYRKNIKNSYSKAYKQPIEGMYYEEGIDKELLYELIKAYNRNFSAKWIASYITIEPDKIDCTNYSSKYKKVVLKCTDRELTCFDNVRLLGNCKERLGISEVIVEKTGATDSKTLKSNIEFLGMCLNEKSEDCLDFKDLFDIERKETGVFYKYEILNNIEVEKVYEKEGAIVYRANKKIYIILQNKSGSGETSFNIKIKDSKKISAGVVKIARVIMAEEYEKILNMLGDNAVSFELEPEKEYFPFKDLNDIELKETVKGRGISLIIINELN